MSIGIERIDHVQVTVPRAVEEEAIRFYGEVLGLERIPKPTEAAKRGGAWFRHAALQVHVSSEENDPQANGGSKRHVCYVVRDLAEAERVLRAAGVEILPDTNPEPGWPRFYARDPGGNRVEIARPFSDTKPDARLEETRAGQSPHDAVEHGGAPGIVHRGDR
jgi:catechol 2,3-dioxygenase-like lactoylglutathione lyase family enzyme